MQMKQPGRALNVYGARLALSFLFFVGWTVPATGRAFTSADIATVQTVSDLSLSPNGRVGLFVKHALDDDRKHVRQTIWVVDVSQRAAPDRLTDGANDSDPRWSPDGSQVAFIRPRELGIGLDVWIINLRTRRQHRLFGFDGEVTDLRWSPDGRAIAFLSSHREQPSRLPSIEPGVHVFTRAKYRTEGHYIDFRNPDQIWMIDLSKPGSIPRRLTGGRQPSRMVGWTPDSWRILFTVDETDEPAFGDGKSGLYEVTAGESPTIRKLTALHDAEGKDRPLAPDMVLSPDGRHLAFVDGAANQPANFAQADLWVMDLATSEVHNLTSRLDEDIDAAPVWQGSAKLLTVAVKAASSNVIAVDLATNTVTKLTSGTHAISAYAAADRSDDLLTVESSGDRPPEIYYCSGHAKQFQLTDLNGPLAARTELSLPESLWFTASDGVKVNAFLQKPPGFDPAKRYPLIVWNHGGPFDLWRAGFNPDVQAMAGAGYLVLSPNVRGSPSYGQAFAVPLASKYPGGRDYLDVLDAVETLSKRPYIDVNHIGVAGSSGGGIMTDWIITHTTRFAAAVSISDIADDDIYWFVGDEATLDANARIPGTIRSRDTIIANVGGVATPTLFISGERDYRTPSSAGGEAMFRALKFLRVLTALVRFDTAGHSIRTSDYPEHIGLRIAYLLRWMDHILRKVEAPEFDVTAPLP